MGKRHPLLPPGDDGPRTVVAGYEYLCPGRDKHLGLRFRDRPDTAVDGDEFPKKAWEASPSFLGIEHPFEVAMALTGRLGAPPAGLKFPAKVDKIDRVRAELGPILQKWLLARPVAAQWLVVHDTAGWVKLPKVPPNAEAINLFVGLNPGKGDHDGVSLRHDFADGGGGVKFETLHPEFRGKLIHVELNHEEGDAPCTDFQHDALVRVYLSASYRAGKWLTVTSHREVDRGIAWLRKGVVEAAHWDPRGFDFGRFYKAVAKTVGLPETATFGILQARHDFKLGSYLDHRNTFPVQYGAVQKEEFLPVLIPGVRGGIVPYGAVPVAESRTEVDTPKKAETPKKKAT